VDRGRAPARTHLTQDPRREAEIFDALVAEHGDFNPFTERGWATLKRGFERLVRPRGGLRLLDLGCGTGQSAKLYLDRAERYVGCDLSFASLAIARRERRGPHWANGDATRLPFAESSLDAVCFSSILHHLPENYVDALREAHRVVRPGGFVFAFDPNVLHPAMALLRHPRSPFYDPRGVSPQERPLAPGELRARFRDAGLVDVRQRALAGIEYRAVAPGGADRLLPAYHVADRLLAASGLGRWIGAFALTVGFKR
jgi:SAM-dependent methyltransferase